MLYAVTSTLLDACVLGVLRQKQTYGYEITQEIKKTIDVSESTLYPVLRRLQKSGFLETYDQPFDGRNRRYYKITEQGNENLDTYISEWKKYKVNIDTLILGGNDSNDTDD